MQRLFKKSSKALIFSGIASPSRGQSGGTGKCPFANQIPVEREIPADCVFVIMGGETSMKKLMEVFYTKLEDSDQVSLFKGND